MLRPSHSSPIIISGTAEMVESFKHCPNIMDNKLNGTYKHCQQKLFVVRKLKVLSVADRHRLFGSLIESVLLSLSSTAPSAASPRWQPPTGTDSNITRLWTRQSRRKVVRATHDPEPGSFWSGFKVSRLIFYLFTFNIEANLEALWVTISVYSPFPSRLKRTNNSSAILCFIILLLKNN